LPATEAIEGDAMSDAIEGPRPGTAGPPSKHQLALMIWLAVFPTLTIVNLTLGNWLSTLSPVVRTFVLATVAVPIVIYGLMPQMHRLRARFLNRVVRT
jgi:antibiotic biosynthesis monooxygenase (ABM) superfamily enzyme